MDRPLLDRPPDDPVRLLDSDGALLGGYEPTLSETDLLSLYGDMRLGRRFDERMISLQRQGRLGTYAPLAGQEGSQFGSMYALSEDDWVFYQYREHAAPLSRGFPPEYLRYWAGYEEGNAVLADHRIFPLNICIGDHVPHATGMAWASKLQDNDDEEAFVCHFGDGATSEGDFHEGLNFAGVFDTPTVFMCHNNGWAISVPREEQTRSATLAEKADAYGFEGVQVDGMDPLAVYEVTRAAVEKAKTPGDTPRPTLVETLEYRYGAHTTADDPGAYRGDEEVDAWREKDPIDRLEAYLRDEGVLDDATDERIDGAIEDALADAVETLESVEPDPDDMFADAFAEPTPRMEAQREYLRALRERHGDDALVRDE
ncbi:pyruvate dehydrogenase (acetyl-transferring) E1 component subunit alpha [Halorarius halobius]|uniref:pyruvate dehydrogenase (acetyl-transferring) E1 component subunit alpha n=1 Tax=Halorarius halobius TaxID=2962671 RepID=UPI0020CB87A9|nr:pyruvate dehydrogenase (acetyl-transferring) E1 component subunit alpha [Halorarius halobius]